jgi:lipid-A-disaccharide synthase
MTAQGFDAHVSMDQLAVRGYTEALRHYRRIARIRRELGDALLAERPGLFIGVDASDFNLDLERRLKEAGIPAVHYVSPSIWAWRGWRVKRVARSATHLLAMFPFEPRLYERTGLPVTYVGHPLADVIPLQVNKDEARVQLRLPPRKLIIAVAAGEPALGTRIHGRRVRACRAPAAPGSPRSAFRLPHGVARDARPVRDDGARAWAHRSPAHPVVRAFARSAGGSGSGARRERHRDAGSGAVQDAHGDRLPPVVLSWALQRRMMYLPYVGMPNILAGEALVPELLQGNATPAALAAALLDLLRDTAAQRRQVEKFREFHVLLRQNTADKAADAVLGVLDAGRA